MIAISKLIRDIIQKRCNRIETDQKLVIAGYTHYKTDYNTHLQKRIKNNSRIILSGFVTGEPLAQLYSHAGLFVLPSYKERYFKCGDVMDLKEKIEYHLNRPVTMAEKSIFRACIREKYNWEKIAVQTLKVYEKALAKELGSGLYYCIVVILYSITITLPSEIIHLQHLINHSKI